jgi:hypothetical protein
METELSLQEVAKKVENWRKTKKHRGEILPKEIADDIIDVAKLHKRSRIGKLLKMSGGTLNKILSGNFNSSRKARKNYSIEERITLLKEWEHSGVSIEEFCSARNISKSSFYQWHRQLSLENSRSNWAPLQAVQPTRALDTVTIEFPLPNQKVASIKLSKSHAVDFFQELYHAITVIR